MPRVRSVGEYRCERCGGEVCDVDADTRAYAEVQCDDACVQPVANVLLASNIDFVYLSCRPLFDWTGSRWLQTSKAEVWGSKDSDATASWARIDCVACSHRWRVQL